MPQTTLLVDCFPPGNRYPENQNPYSPSTRPSVVEYKTIYRLAGGLYISSLAPLYFQVIRKRSPPAAPVLKLDLP